jgi:hypothetical protein
MIRPALTPSVRVRKFRKTPERCNCTVRIQSRNMPKIICLLLSLSAIAAPWATSAPQATGVYTSLWLYSGSWRVTRKDRPADKLTNQCALVGRYFTCEQTVNGVAGNLLIFIPTPNKTGHYYTQNVTPEGRATSRGDLEIQGDRWQYSSTWDQGGSTVYYRTTNVFIGKTRIQFEQAESTDNKNWIVKNTGEEIRLAGPGR